MSASTAVTESTFDAEVLKSDVPVLVDFWAAWCGPCRAVGPILDQIAEEQQGKLRIVKVNVDENPQLSAQYRITSIPAMKVFQNGAEVTEIIGAQPKQSIERALQAQGII
ncbi:thioredoxin [Leucobacter sp. M11]|uniref:thioredoxin n=1 Tax=Leucobacter sp. M11 TaxID=2993565 RepID=UPI002D806A1F|nr:thioredoxin [Leucobacter sp. M11]MEB4614883.1 thioredoxin [Leucobacter sp. M11]